MLMKLYKKWEHRYLIGGAILVGNWGLILYFTRPPPLPAVGFPLIAEVDDEEEEFDIQKIKARKKHAEKDSGFLRIGSLNVRVKKTTEAVSNFLGVGTIDRLHKSWGSADNLPQGDSRKMPPPKYAPIKKRKSKRAMDFAPPSRPESVISTKSVGGGFGGGGGGDSDSDTAAGFGTNWQATA